MKGLKSLFMLALLSCLCLMLSGCQEVRSVIVDHIPDAGTENTDTGSGYNIYYISNDETQVGAFSYQLQATSQSGIIDECLDVLTQQPSDENYQPVLSDALELDHYEYDEETTTLALYFDSRYAALSEQKEILVRCALTKTLTQFDSLVSAIEINADGQWISDSQGEPLKMNTDDFVINYETGKVEE